MLTKLKTFREDKEEGFTLIELLIVILIIGILSAIAIPAFMNQRKEAVDASLKADARNLVIAMETWKIKNADKKHYPSAAWRAPDSPISLGSHNVSGIPFEPTEGNYLRTYDKDGSSFCIEAWSAGSSQWTSELKPYRYFQEDGVPGRDEDC